MPRWQIEKSNLIGSIGIDRAQRRGDVGGHAPAGALEPGQPQALPHADDVRVERHDQLARTDLLPHAEIDPILADHPAQEQVQPLACAARRWPREEIRDAGLRPLATIDRRHVERERARRERLQRLADIDRSLARPSTKKSSIDPLRSIICRRIHTSAAKSAPLVQRWTRCLKRRDRCAGSKPRTNAAGEAPITASMPSIEFSTLCTRPNASADAMNATTSLSAASCSGEPSTPDPTPNGRH